MTNWCITEDSSLKAMLHNNTLLFCLLTFLFPLLGCDSKTETIVGNLPDAENLFFTPEGRLFASGGENVFEVILLPDGSYQKLDTFHKDCLVEGIVQTGDFIYGVCSKTSGPELLDSYLIAGLVKPLDTGQWDPNHPDTHPTIELEIISPLSEILIPNGMSVDSLGNLYIADYGSSNIYKVELDSPTQVARISIWKKRPYTLFNGLKWVNNQLYFSAQSGITSGIVGRITQLDDGSAGELEVLFERKKAVVDDILPYKDGILITDYLKGSIVFWKDGQIITETTRETFFAPTAVIQTQGPMFPPGALLVTEKGIIGDSRPAYGNKIGIFYPDF